MSTTRDDAIEEWSGSEENHNGWIVDSGPVTLHEDHQRIDVKNTLQGYPRKDRGFWCESCGGKCTLGPNLETEYGHGPKCEHRNVDRKAHNKMGKD